MIYVVATTKVFNGDALLDTCGEDAERLETRLRVAHDTGGAPPS